MFKKYRNTVMEFIRKGLSPSEIAYAVALGNFVGILPFLGLHTIMAVGMAYILRLNVLIVFLGTQISNPFTFPFILYISAQAGSLLLNRSFLDMEFSNDLQVWKSYIMPTLIGSVILGFAVSAVSYVITLKLARRYMS